MNTLQNINLKILFAISITAGFVGCTTTTNLELTPVYDVHRVVEKEGLFYNKTGGKKVTGHLAVGARDGNTTVIYMEIKDGRVTSGWCMHPRQGRKYTVLEGNGSIIEYDPVTGDIITSREVSNGRLGETKQVELSSLRFLQPPAPENLLQIPKIAGLKNDPTEASKLRISPVCKSYQTSRMPQATVQANVCEAQLAEDKHFLTVGEPPVGDNTQRGSPGTSPEMTEPIAHADTGKNLLIIQKIKGMLQALRYQQISTVTNEASGQQASETGRKLQNGKTRPRGNHSGATQILIIPPSSLLVIGSICIITLASLLVIFLIIKKGLKEKTQ